MTLQNVFQKSENLAVAVIFTLFIISHFGLLYLLRVGREEALMRDTFGADWDAYAARTPRVIPALRRG